MPTRIDLSQDIKIKDPFAQEDKHSSDLLNKVGQKGEVFSHPLEVLAEEAEGKEPRHVTGKHPRKKPPAFLEEGGSGGVESPFEHFLD